ncbi:MAG: alpha-glucosidase [Rhodobacteraceae bacterium]|nr:alpha-glucosidase [Paracoccaceae bacterium]MBR26633.1 alpha-glucosidase [Paracoccaceae bacterium]
MSLNDDPDWWRGAVIYQVYLRSFQDSDGNGIGDLEGLRRRLPHIAGLGADAVWITPFFRSPMKDFGYDVSGYGDVDPMFGTMADFDAVVAEAHRLGLRIVIDLVLSHTSDAHPWFVESRGAREGPRADWYVWAEAKPDGTAPNNWLSIFGGPAWEWDTTRLQYYLHNFLAAQPDLNFHNPEVQDAMLAVAEAWLKRGVDGFRLDTVNFYFHDAALTDNPPLPPEQRNANTAPMENPYNFQDHLHDKTQPENLVFLRRLRALCDRYGGRALLGEVGESQRGREVMAAYTAGGDKLHMCYDFDFLAPDPPTPARAREVIEGVEAVSETSWPCWAFSNHDTVRHVTRWGAEAPGRAAVLAALLLSLRGSVCLYQGEELALPEARIAFEDIRDPYGLRLWPKFRGRDGARTPMPWETDAPNAGFSEAAPWLPAPEAHRPLAVDRQEGDPASPLHAYRRLLAFRRAHPALIRGTLEMAEAGPDLLAFARRDPATGDAVFCAFNLTDAPHAGPAPWEAETLEIPGPAPLFGGRMIDGSLRLGPWDAWFGMSPATGDPA